VNQRAENKIRKHIYSIDYTTEKRVQSFQTHGNNGEIFLNLLARPHLFLTRAHTLAKGKSFSYPSFLDTLPPSFRWASPVYLVP